MDGGVAIAESAAINTYLGDKFSSALVPRAGTIERGLYDMWCFFLISELDASLVIWGRHHYYEVKNGAAPAALAAAKEYLRKQMKVVVDELAQKEYLMGSAFTAVDILLVTILRWAKRVEWLPEDEASTKVIEAYLDRLYARPAFKKTLEQTDTVPPPRPTATPSE